VLMPGDILKSGLVLIEQDFSARPALENPDIHWTGVWHSEAFQPNEAVPAPAGSPAVLRMRYVEYGRYIVTEDWVWRANGLVSRISQWWPKVKRCWRHRTRTGSCTESEMYGTDPHNDARAVETFVPQNRPDQADVTLLPLESNGTAFTMRLMQRYKDDGTFCTYPLCQPYSGFVEIKVNGSNAGLWRDIAGRPIYLHRGMVRVPPGASALPSGTVELSVRPYFSRYGIDAFTALPNPTMPAIPPNASSGGWSNTQPLTTSVN